MDRQSAMATRGASVAKAPRPDVDAAGRATRRRVARSSTLTRGRTVGDGAMGEAKNLADESFRAWICIPDLSARRSEVVDALDAVVAPRRFGVRGEGGAAPYAVAGGTPLADYAPVRGGFGVPWPRVLDRCHLPNSVRCCRAPELQASESEVQRRRRALGPCTLVAAPCFERSESCDDMAGLGRDDWRGTEGIGETAAVQHVCARPSRR